MLSYVIPAQETTASNGRPTGRSADADIAGVASGQVPSPPRNSLSLRLTTQYMAGEHHSEVDALLANVASGHEYCDERTHLLYDTTNRTSSPVRVKRQNSNGSNNNNPSSLNNNATSNITSTSGDISCSAPGGHDGCDDVVNVNVNVVDGDETLFGDAVADVADKSAVDDNNADDKQVAQQQQQHDESHNPRQTIATKKPKLSKLGSNKTVGLKRWVHSKHFQFVCGCGK